MQPGQGSGGEGGDVRSVGALDLEAFTATKIEGAKRAHALSCDVLCDVCI